MIIKKINLEKGVDLESQGPFDIIISKTSPWVTASEYDEESKMQLEKWNCYLERLNTQYGRFGEEKDDGDEKEEEKEKSEDTSSVLFFPLLPFFFSCSLKSTRVFLCEVNEQKTPLLLQSVA